MARQRKKTYPIVTALIFGIVAFILLFFGIRDFIGMHGELLNVNTCDPSEIKAGTYIEADLTMGYGRYIEKTTTYNHIVTKTDGYYYLVDVCDKNVDGTAKDTAKWIGVSVRKADADKYESISYDENPAPVSIKGVVKANTSKIQGFLDDYLESYCDLYAREYGITPTEEDYASIKAEALPYYIEVKTDFEYMFNIGVGLILLLVAIIFVVVSAKKKRVTASSYQGSGTAQNYNTDYNGTGYTGAGYDSSTFGTPGGSTYTDPIYNQQPDNPTAGTQYNPYASAEIDSQQMNYSPEPNDAPQNPYTSGYGSSGNFSLKQDNQNK